MAEESDEFFSPCSSTQGTSSSSLDSSLSDNSVDSVSSEHLDVLRNRLNLQSTTPSRRRIAFADSGSVRSQSIEHCTDSFEQNTSSSDKIFLDNHLFETCNTLRHTATTPPAKSNEDDQNRKAVRSDANIISLLSSSSSDEDAWAVTQRPATRRKRQVVEDSSSEEDGCDENDQFAYCPSPEGQPASPTKQTSILRNPTALPSYFASIGALQSLHINSNQDIPNQQATPRPKQGPALQDNGAETRQFPSIPSPTKTPGRGAAKAPQSVLAFKRKRERLTRQLFEEYNRQIFYNKLPADLEIKWNNRLNSTAGLTHYRREIPPELHEPPRYCARVELSSKVLDSKAKLERTLCHELCHVAAWLIDHTAKPPHGPLFKKWADQAMRAFPHLDITTCHSYDIFYAYRWQCSNHSCGQTFGRHSNSIDISKKVCGGCKSQLLFLGRFQQDGTPAKPRAPTAFSAFVKENYQDIKQQEPAGTPHAHIMRKLSTRWAETQQKPPSKADAISASAL